MPKAADEHHDDEIDHGARGAVPVAAQRNVEVVAQEGGERDVPALPEIGETDRGIGEAEVILQMEPEAERGADGANGVSREVEKYLSGKREHTDPRIERQQRPAIVEDAIGRAREQRIGEHHFFEKTQRHQKQTPQEPALLRLRRMLELRKEIARTHDRSCHELRKERNREREIAQRPRRPHHAAVDVERVGEGVKGVERDADGQEDIEVRRLVLNAATRQRPGEVLEEEVPVLEKAEHAQVHGHADPEPDLALVWFLHRAHFSAEIEIECSRREEEHSERRIPRAVKEVARDEEQILPRFPRAHRPVRAQNEHEKDDKGERVEQHRSRRLSDCDGFAQVNSDCFGT